LIYAFIKPLPVLAFIFMGVAGFIVALRLKRAGSKGTWSLLIAIGACLAALAWLTLAAGYFFDYGIKPSIPALDAIVYTYTFRILFYPLALTAAILFLVAAVKAKKSLAKSTTSGVWAAILLAAYVIGEILYITVITLFMYVATMGSTVDNDTLFMVMAGISYSLFLLLLGFALCQTICFAGISKHLRRPSGGAQELGVA